MIFKVLATVRTKEHLSLAASEETNRLVCYATRRLTWKIELHIKKKVYLKPYQNSFERVNFSVKFEAAGGGRETVDGRGWLWVVQAKLRLVVDGHGWSFNIAYFYRKSKKLHSFLNSKCVTRDRTFYLQTKVDTLGLIGRFVLVGYVFPYFHRLQRLHLSCLSLMP